MSSEEEDYMSSVFVTAVQQPAPATYRQLKRPRQAEAPESVKRSLPKLEAERRDAGLGQRLEETNRGFAMMSRMGYRAGTGLGSAGQGRTEPIGVSVKDGRKGLGLQTATRELTVRREARRRRDAEEALSAFRASLSEKARQRQTEMDLSRSQKVCAALDRDAGREEPLKLWFWPPPVTEEPDKDDGDSEEELEDNETALTTEDKLTELTVHLRQVHSYCVWCGVKYLDSEDWQSCPGPTRELHDDL